MSTVVAQQTCRLRTSLFGVCGEESKAQCQYCGRAFCARHGVLLDDGQEVCSRKQCVAKREDLERHLVFKERVAGRNQAQRCGVEACTSVLASQCARCKGLFCADHVRKREETVFENKVRVPRMATLCDHCWARRPIWLKT